MASAPLFSKTVEFERGLFATAVACPQGLCGLSVGFEAKAGTDPCEIPPQTLAVIESALSDVFSVIKGGDKTVCAPGLSGFVFPEASEFRLNVWRETSKIPRGETRTYSEIAMAVGKANSRRAVAGALAANVFAILIPCHRVVGEKDAGGYSGGGGTKMKKTLLEAESAAGK